MSYLVGILIGAVLGLTGAGGSVFAVPLLISLVYLSPQDAIGVSLAAVGISALFGVFTRLRSRQIQWIPAAVYSVVGGLFAPIGVYINHHMSPVMLMLGFSALVVLVAARMWRQASVMPNEAAIVRSTTSLEASDNVALCIVNDNQPFKIGLPCVMGMSGGAALTGILSGLFGVGGGFLIVPTLLFLTGISIRQAIATSLVIISVVSMSGFISFLASGQSVDYSLLSHVAIGGVIGMSAGVVISKYIAGPTLQKVFSVLMFLMALLTVVTTLTN